MDLRRIVRALVFSMIFVTVSGFSVAVAGGSTPPDARKIHLKAGEFDPVSGMGDLAGLGVVAAYDPGERGAYYVQFDRPIEAKDRQAIEAAGGSVKGYVPMMTLEVILAGENLPAVEKLPGVRWVGPVQPGYKIYPRLLPAFGDGARSAERIELQISIYAGEDEQTLPRILGLGADVRQVDRGRSFVVVRAELPLGQLAALARLPLVRFVEEFYEPAPNNDRSRVLTGLDEIANDDFTAGLDPTLDGLDEFTGFQVKYGHFDSGMQTSLPDFSTATVTVEPGADTSDFSSGHGTHTAGSVVGDGGRWDTVLEVPPGSGSISINKWRGVTPQAALHHISFENDYTDRGIFEREYEEGAHISTNSWSWTNSGSSIPDYNTNAASWDEGVWDADDDAPGLQPLTVLFSAGNGGGFNFPYNGCLSNGGDRVTTPATAKNVITVANNETDRGNGGVCGPNSSLGNNPEQVNASSSRGPVDPDVTGQGLFKPDVSNIGGYWVMSVEASGTGGQCGGAPDCPTDCSNTGANYRYLNGTSMSTPLTAGFAGVVYQDLVVRRGVSEPRPSLIKALLINGARDLQPAQCDYTYEVDQSVIHEGWGFVQAKESIYGPGGGPSQRRVDFENEESAVQTGTVYTLPIDAAAGTPLKVTLVWTDYPASPASVSPLVVNDLDLEVVGPDGTFLGNNFVGNWSVVGGTADRYNVVENVYIENPTGGTYQIRVQGFQVVQDQLPSSPEIDQSFSLVWSGAIMVDDPCGDGSCGGAENRCNCPADCGPPAGIELDCADLDDDDCDGTVDCLDEDCLVDPACQGLCGDGVCNFGEDCVLCPADCVFAAVSCGNGICEIADGEDCVTCETDCPGQAGGNPSDRFCCGTDTGCADARCDPDGNSCTELPVVPYCCGDSVCEGGEGLGNCAIDCTFAAGVIPADHGPAVSPLLAELTLAGEVSLSWMASCVTTDDDFVVYEGTIGDYTSHSPRSCSTGGATSSSFPATGDSAYYLVVPHNGAREGSYGTDSGGAERPASTSACLVQEVGVCQ